jgi:thiol-disulfide isomerase/thioredoxin
MHSFIDLSAENLIVSGEDVYVSHPSVGKNPGMMLIWASWCPHCHHFLPTFNRLARKLKTGFSCVGVEYSVLKTAPDVSKALKFSGFPSIKFFDQNGKVIDSYDGPRDMASILDYICKLYHHCIMHH